MNTSSADSGRVHDAPSNNWVYRVLPRALWPYAQLARWDRPIGWQLLMWPCLWSVALASGTAAAAGQFSLGRFVFHSFLFIAGAIAMRGAGCTFNDIVDHDIDMEVARTRSRPLPSGRVSRFQAKAFMVLQALVGLVVLLQFNAVTIWLGILSLGLVAIYPFAKRFTDWPQFFLGLAFSWGAIMGWSAEFGTLSFAPVLLYGAAIAWTIGYDTIYAYQDREDDELIGVRSTARRFGDNPRPWLIGLYGLAIALMLLAFLAAGAGLFAYLGLLIAAVLLIYQILVLNIHDPSQCLALFKFNGVVGLIIFAGLVAALFVRLI
ncbi:MULTISPECIES: 4-hydroxybenzoate octaprenyltransferase [Ensifer]|jgi:4-hydroxybenzoate polyprenyltransferase|uniref:4-hydroxybenzoate octaprenyltransferase n=1 Tax=Ensifer canadensis TaxID=555315 RepID=A0AAW4FI22_9HYPH|nr:MULTISPECIES: 4-hydroxybenzoate octaprenyltransferase [Ensifer]AHK43600.1 putative 4-hydroxybenzoate octaprenyltransferase [Ensifer adhaerens OV14]MDP9628199.1 4-hydroxybenzoate polyprenyltransferase [Ensifer adhaerens]KQU71803.1 4-hydroxybenzoate octaprenyltransferase [Ensifer sp. Root31]KQW62569.1 4-hydroxybenzoate octaprenyltransferase [Ensifer sp. Root1252]KQW84680.1 4-hydroxybenzoate octaprenyltransferase [Ensifer sp. Root127]